MSYSNLRVCAQCGTGNRVPAKFLTRAGRCGKCQSALPPLSSPIEADSATFDEIVRETSAPVLTDFWAAWCGPCRMAAPEVAALAAEMAGRAVVLKVDTERNPDLAARYRVQSIPNFLLIKNGQVLMQQPGLVPRAEMRRWIEQAIL